MAMIVTILFEIVRNNKLKYSLLGISLICITTLIFNPKLIWELFYLFNLTGHAAVDLNADQIMGFNRSTFIKPFYAIFQMIFGPNIAPTFSIFTFGIFLFISIMLIYILYRHFKEEKTYFIEHYFLCNNSIFYNILLLSNIVSPWCNSARTQTWDAFPI